jgi:hypothetical protein
MGAAGELHRVTLRGQGGQPLKLSEEHLDFALV